MITNEMAYQVMLEAKSRGKIISFLHYQEFGKTFIRWKAEQGDTEYIKMQEELTRQHHMASVQEARAW